MGRAFQVAARRRDFIFGGRLDTESAQHFRGTGSYGGVRRGHLPRGSAAGERDLAGADRCGCPYLWIPSLGLGFSLLPFFGNLMLFGWFLGMISTALILRWGQAAESLAWAVPFFIQPFAAVFYPLSVLPVWLQPLANALPCTPIFEGMRAVLAGQAIPWSLIQQALILNGIWGAVATWFFAANLRHVRKTGLLVKVATQ